MKLDPVSLKIFLHIVEQGTITGAADRCHIAASAASKRISDLEDLFKTPLLARTNKGVVATPAGIALTPMARNVLHELDGIYTHMHEYSRGMRGLVRVAANLSAITQFLPLAIKQFLVAYPRVQVQLHEDVSAGVTKAVMDNMADIGIFTACANDQHLEVFPYHKDELALVTPLDHPLVGRQRVPFVDTLAHDFVGLHNGSAINRQLIKVASELGRTIKMAIQVTSFDAACMMVDAGLGIAILPRTAALPYLASHRLNVVGLSDDWTVRELKICVRALSALSAPAQLLVQHLQNGIC
jgi:DNA-binding transcriptional LysR family regulator